MYPASPATPRYLPQSGRTESRLKEQLGGFGHREHDLLSCNHPVLYKTGHISRHLLGREPVIPIHKFFHAQRLGVGGVRREQIRQIQRAGFAGLRLLQLAADHGAVGHVGHVEQNALFLAHRIVELGQQTVHGRIGLLAVDVPDADHGGTLGREQGLTAAAACQPQAGYCRRKGQKRPSLHDALPFLP